MYLLDTNVLSELVRRRPNPGVVTRIQNLAYEDTNASVITFFELRYGAMRRGDGSEFWVRLERQIIRVTKWIDADVAVARRAGDITAELNRNGIPIGTEDALIGATALEHNLTMVSRKSQLLPSCSPTSKISTD